MKSVLKEQVNSYWKKIRRIGLRREMSHTGLSAINAAR